MGSNVDVAVDVDALSYTAGVDIGDIGVRSSRPQTSPAIWRRLGRRALDGRRIDR